MLGKILKKTFWGWWDHISYSIINSLMGGLNPFFIILIMGVMWALTEDVTLFSQNIQFFSLVFGASLLAMSSFPTTVAAYAVQEKLLDGENISYFRQFWEELGKVWLRSLLVCLIYVIIGGLLVYSIVFYLTALGSWFPINMVFVVISAWFYFYLLISQTLFTPMLATDKVKIYEYFAFSLYTTAKNGLRLLLISSLSLVAFLVFAIPLTSKITAIIPLLTYFGFMASLQIWSFRYIVGEVDEREVDKKRKIGEIFSPFAFLFPKKKNKKNE